MTALEVITQASDKLPSGGVIVSVAAAAIEFGLRFCKTAKPASLFYTTASIIKALGALFTKAGVLLDSVLQNVKIPDVAVEAAPVVVETK
jgi:hypothetical protein